MAPRPEVQHSALGFGPVLDLLEEFRALVQALETGGVEFAVCGGLAVAIEEAERLMSEADAGLRGERDAGWDNETLRDDATPDAAAREGAEPPA